MAKYSQGNFETITPQENNIIAENKWVNMFRWQS